MIQDCHRCNFGVIGVECDGPVPCRQDPQRRDIIAMQAHGCPIGKFPAGLKCERCGGTHHFTECNLPNPDAKAQAVQGGCGC